MSVIIVSRAAIFMYEQTGFRLSTGLALAPNRSLNMSYPNKSKEQNTRGTTSPTPRHSETSSILTDQRVASARVCARERPCHGRDVTTETTSPAIQSVRPSVAGLAPNATRQ